MKVSKKKKLCLSVLLSVFLSGCMVKNVAEDYSLDDTKGKGVAVVSLTRSGVADITAMSVNLRGVDNNHRAIVPVTAAGASSDYWKCPWFGGIPEDEPCGHLAILELPQGEYEFHSWQAGGLMGKTTPTREFSIRFKVIPGKAVYLGNIHFSFPFGFRCTRRITDMRGRDLHLLYLKNPNITADDVIVRICQ